MRSTFFALALLCSACGGAEEAATKTGDVNVTVASPATVARGSNTFTIRIDHPHATAVEATLWMPSMGHGAPYDPRAVKLDDTTYRLEDAMFSMPGAWDLRVKVTCPHGVSTQTFRYEVP